VAPRGTTPPSQGEITEEVEKMIYKRGKKGTYWYKFMWQGELIRESTKQSNDKQARKMEAAHRTALANGLVGIREKKLAPVLGDFLRKEFVPYVETKHANKPLTVRTYVQVANNMLGTSSLTGLRLDQITDQHAQQFVGQRSHLSASRINMGLRVLRLVLHLAEQWGKLDRAPKIALAKGERRRERVLTDAELAAYLDGCTPRWRAIATLIADEGMRPSEVFNLDWPHVLLSGNGGLIAIADGKSANARRTLPMTPRVHALLTARYEQLNKPSAGLVFTTRTGKALTSAYVGRFHRRALERSRVARFEPYCLRHTALTRLAVSGADAFTLARIAGHSSITMTQRYCHPQADAIERAFQAAHPPLALAAN
jgi:integrase